VAAGLRRAPEERLEHRPKPAAHCRAALEKTRLLQQPEEGQRGVAQGVGMLAWVRVQALAPVGEAAEERDILGEAAEERALEVAAAHVWALFVLLDAVPLR
jgi:hypothetical protein